MKINEFNCHSMGIQEAISSLRQLRVRSNLTQKELALRVGMPYSRLRRLESNGIGSLADYLRVQEFLRASLAEESQYVPISVAQKPGHPSTRQRVRKPKLRSTAVPENSLNQAPSAPSLSSKLGLDFPYDWSNPAMSEDILIAKVLEKARFTDVSKVFANFGHARVKQVARDFDINLNEGVLGTLMPGIELGWAQYNTQHVSH